MTHNGSIGTERLLLEPQMVEDAVEMAGVFSDPALFRFIGGSPPTIDDVRERFATQEAGRSPDGTEEWRNWVVRRRADGVAVGTVQATIFNERPEAVIAWVIGTPWQRNGYATEAARALATWLLDRGVRAIQANIDPDHAASAAVARRAGLVKTSRMVDGERVWRRRAVDPTARIRFPLLTERLVIRPTVDADVPALHRVWGDAEVMRHLGPPLRSVDDTRALLAAKIAQQDRDGLSLWTVVERATGGTIGTGGLQHEDGPEIGVGFLFSKASWGRGYGREAVAATIRAGFDELRLDRIMGITEPANLAARRVMESVGMTLLGPARYYGRSWTSFEVLRVSGEIAEE